MPSDQKDVLGLLSSYLKTINVTATCVHMTKTHILAMSKTANSGKISLLSFDLEKRKIVETMTFDGSDCFLLADDMEKVFAGIDNKLFLCDREGKWKIVLETKSPSNFFWHLVTTKSGSIYVQEYGEPPTGVYESVDGEKWELLVTAQKIDKKALHFHDIAYDPYRDMLIVTLGDRNYVKTAVSKDLGNSWIPIYKGAWQLLPIAVTKEYIVFGMDSGLARGGLVKWYPESEHYDVIHLDWRKNRSDLMQMADLKRLSNEVWMAALGKPQAIIASDNLNDWQTIFEQGFDSAFDYNMSLSEGENIVAFSTGKQIVWISKEDLGKLIKEDEPTIHRRYALLDRLTGIGYVMKRKIESFR